MPLAAPSFHHLLALSDDTGIFEHARHDVPRREHGYCVDDVSRGLIVIVREPDASAELDALGETSLRFLEGALGPDGSSRNRMDAAGSWTDEPALGDWWGRSVWALGTAAAGAGDPLPRKRALRAFHLAAAQRSPHLRSMTFAALGAGEVLLRFPDDELAHLLLRDAVDAIFAASSEAPWPWPEPRLTYANAAIPEALILAGMALGAPEVTLRGLALLEFLFELQSDPGHLSVPGSDGRDPGDQGPQFDQQPIEIAALADACARAYAATGNAYWLDGVRLAWEWFEGRNDSDTVMFDALTGAGYDGLERMGRNANRGAESTLAVLSTHQQARRLGVLDLAMVAG
ncbi:glycosyltransferase [Microbacteriaceae bacterium 4G12]